MPARDPAEGGISQGDQALVDLACALLDGIFMAGQLEELFAVWATFATELGLWHYDAAHHAGAQHAVLRWRYEVGHDVIEVTEFALERLWSWGRRSNDTGWRQ